ncbi:MAG: LCP family protein [Actinobacteria bacterium]|nr:LCP family protein [Actinomycetota bacterium]
MTSDDHTQAYDPFAPPPPPADDQVWSQLDRLPTIDDEPVVYDHRAGGFVRVDQSQSPKAPRPEQTRAADPAHPQRPGAGYDPTHVAPRAPLMASKPADESPVGWQRSGAPPSRAGGPPGAAPPAAPPPRAYRPAPPPPPPMARPAAPRPAPVKAKPVKAGRSRRGGLAKRLVLALLAFAVLLGSGLFVFGWWQFNTIPRVDVASALSPQTGPGTNYLIVGTDSREGMTAADPNAGAFLGPGDPTGPSRTDSIMILRVEGSSSSLLSIPRDLYVTNPKSNEKTRINAVYQSGPAALIKAVQNLGIPVHQYAEINFVSFAGLVDAVGGIDVNFPFPTRDVNSGLKVDQPGVQRLDGVQGLAYVRSRYYEELKNGKWVADPQSDLSRVVRQRTFLAALLQKMTESKNPYTLLRVAGAFGGGLKIDNKLGYLQALGLAWRLRGFNPTSNTIPTRPVTIGGAAVLQLAPDSAQVLGQYK